MGEYLPPLQRKRPQTGDAMGNWPCEWKCGSCEPKENAAGSGGEQRWILSCLFPLLRKVIFHSAIAIPSKLRFIEQFETPPKEASSRPSRRRVEGSSHRKLAQQQRSCVDPSTSLRCARDDALMEVRQKINSSINWNLKRSNDTERVREVPTR